MNNDFFPSSDYKVPITSNYMRLVEGTNTFRVMSSAIVGWEYFSKDMKPVRNREPFEEYPTDIKVGGKVSHFWAFVVWNYEAKKIQVLELTQKSIMNPIESLVKNPKWGSPKGYDITITRKGTGLSDTEYNVVPEPHSDAPDEAVKNYEALKINLDALYSNLDPFAKNV